MLVYKCPLQPGCTLQPLVIFASSNSASYTSRFSVLIGLQTHFTTEGMPEMTSPWGARYAWPLLWLGMRIEADDATRHRDRREPVPDAITGRCAQLAGLAAEVQTPAPGWEAYRELTTAERARAEGTGTPATWLAAVSAWRREHEPVLRGPDYLSLPGTRYEVETLQRLLGKRCRTLLGSDASEQELDTLPLKQFRIPTRNVIASSQRSAA